MTRIIFLGTLLILAQSSVLANRNNPKLAMLIIDVQDCFLQGGSLAVSDGNDVIPVINGIRDKYGKRFSIVALSLDWHPLGHVSFASSHPGKKPFESVQLSYKSNGSICDAQDDPTFQNRFPMAVSCDDQGSKKVVQQNLWPDHCIQNVNTGPTSSRLADTLTIRASDIFINKGIHKEVDSYSAFYDNGRFAQTDLNKILKANGITHVFVMGLATDYCVYFTSLDAHGLGYETYTVLDASRGVAPDTVQKAITDLASKGVHLINSKDLDNVIDDIFMPDASSTSTTNMFLIGAGFLLNLSWRFW